MLAFQFNTGLDARWLWLTDVITEKKNSAMASANQCLPLRFHVAVIKSVEEEGVC